MAAPKACNAAIFKSHITMKHIEVAAAIIYNSASYFACQRGYGDFEGLWEFPGGKIEPGESPEDALKREVQEADPGRPGQCRPLCADRGRPYGYRRHHSEVFGRIRLECYLERA